MQKENFHKDFVSYDEATDLKELGFDKHCFGLFVIDKSLLIKEMPNQQECEQYFGGILAPTYSQAFRWFREKYNFDIQILGTHFRASWAIGIPLEINEKAADGYPMVLRWNYIISEGKKVDSYEEAELACLKKLIEIIKNKNHDTL